MAKAAQTASAITIKPLNMRKIHVTITGNAPLVVAAFSAKAANAMMTKMQQGQQAKKGKARDARDFNEDCEQARHRPLGEEWDGVAASAFRQAMISVCRLVGFKMTLAKMSLFVEADGTDRVTGIPLVKIDSKGGHEVNISPVRNATGVLDLRARPMWRDWSITLRIKFDADQFSLDDVVNLLSRAGHQAGIGEGRPDSKASAGLGWGTFDVTNVVEEK